MKIIIAPSLLSSDPMNYAAALSDMATCSVSTLHVDVMDGHFVPNLTFGLPLVTALSTFNAVTPASQFILDVHLMISNPEEMAPLYVKAGAQRISFHWEAATHPLRLIKHLKDLGATQVGIALNPSTSVAVLQDTLAELDFVLLLSVNPGFSGQKFMPLVFPKVTQLQEMISQLILKTQIAVDGGIDSQNIKELIKRGASFFVVGNTLFSNHKFSREAYEKLIAQTR